MGVYFLFSLNVLLYAFFGRITPTSIGSREFSLASKGAIDKIFELSKDSSDCFLYCPAQVVDKIKGGFSSDQSIRFNELVEKESTTLGVKNFNPEDKETLLESAKALSEKGYTLVIVEKDEDKKYIEENEKVIALTPAEFITLLNDAIELHETLDMKEIKVIDILIISLFRRSVIEEESKEQYAPIKKEDKTILQ